MLLGAVMRVNETKGNIIEKSWNILEEEGLVGFSMRKLAKKVDMTVSSLYYHFESKEALFGELINEACGKIAYPIDEKDLDRRLFQYGNNILTVLNEYDQLAQLLMMYPPMSSNYAKLMDNLLMIIDELNISDNYKLYTVNYYLTSIFTFKLDSQNISKSEKQSLIGVSAVGENMAPYLYKYKKAELFGSQEMFEFELNVIINGIKSFEKNL